MRNDLLIFLPTYNEAANIGTLLEQILALNLMADIVVMDDNSPDGTGKIVEAISERNANVRLWRREAKLGIGSAHLMALAQAQVDGYKTLITLDADFSHQPFDIPRFLAVSDQYDIVVGSRYLRENSLLQWNMFRKAITRFGHVLTKTFLRLPYDASGAFRLYRLDRIPPSLFKLIQSRDYEFFFESLTILHINGCRIGEVPIDLPARVYGHSKMEFNHMVRGLMRLLRLSVKLATARRTLVKAAQPRFAQPESRAMRVAWDDYWGDKGERKDRSLYDAVASFYRNRIIKPSLNHFIRQNFPAGAHLIHAGCGGGEVDVDVVRYAKVTAVDISPIALTKYNALHCDHAETVLVDIFALSGLGHKFDGLYNLGVMEHFEEPELRRLFLEFNAVLKPGGRLVLFWPPAYGLSVIALHGIHFVLNQVLRRNVQLHPPEPTKVRSRRQIARYLEGAGFQLTAMNFGIRDMFTYAIIIAQKDREVVVDHRP